jgi:S1-C subfamily serine protease
MLKLAQSSALITLTLIIFSLSRAQAPKPVPRSSESFTNKAVNAKGLPFDAARNMTVAVFREQINLAPLQVGSAVWLGDNGYLVTCSHVIGNWTGPLSIGIETIPRNSSDRDTLVGNMNILEVTVVANDRSMDVAILKANRKLSQIHADQFGGVMSGGVSVTQMPLLRGASLQTKYPEPGRPVLLAGYPLTERVLILQTGISTGLDFIKGEDIDPETTLSRLRIMLSLVSNPGNSGGPVFDDVGKVIGLLEGNLGSPIRDGNGNQLYCIRAKTDESGKVMLDISGKPITEAIPCMQNSGISLAVPAKFIFKLAQENKIPLE